jgi:hypothetical protein
MSATEVTFKGPTIRIGQTLQEIMLKVVIPNKPDVNTLLGIVELDGTMLEALDMQYQTSAIVLAAVTQNGLALEHCKLTQTLTIVNAAVAQNGMALQYVSRAAFNSSDLDAIELAAVTQTYRALMYVRQGNNTLFHAAFPTA